MVGLVEEWWIRGLIGLLGSSVIAFAAYFTRALSLSGSVAAMLMGTGFVVFGEPVWALLLLVFFVSSSLWSKFKNNSEIKIRAEQNYEKSSRRDAGQVWANGGLGLLLCIGSYAWPSQWWLFIYIGVMASVTADTWATEIGGLSKRRPRSILTFKQMEAGTSGAISILGTTASMAGGLCIGLFAWLASEQISIAMLWITGVAGTVGALIDSWLGATFQVQYRCTICYRVTERLIHCNNGTTRVSGVKWLNNDNVNLLSSLAAGILSLILATWWI